MENKKILLPNKKYIGSSDKDIQIRVGLENNSKNLIEGSYSYTIDSGEQYITERKDSDLFRPYLKVSGMYYSNGTNNPIIGDYLKNYNTNYDINRQSVNKLNDFRNFIAGVNLTSNYTMPGPSEILQFDKIIEDSTPPGYNVGSFEFTVQETTTYIVGTNIRIDLKNTDVSPRNFDIDINILLNGVTILETKNIYNSIIGAGLTRPITTTLITDGVELNSSDTLSIQIIDNGLFYSFLEYTIYDVSTFYCNAQDIVTYDLSLSNIDLLYDPLKVVTNTSVTDSSADKTKSVIFSISAPYDDIIVNNISPLTTIMDEKTIELIDYWYLPTDIKKDGSYVTDNYTNNSGDPVIVGASTGWINIGKFMTGTTESDLTQSNVLRTVLFSFRGNMGVKIPKYETYSFFITVKSGDIGYLKTSYAYDSVAGFMGLSQNMASGDTLNIKSYQQYCWLNIWPDSYELDSANPNIAFRDYYGWTNTSGGNVYEFQPSDVITDFNSRYAFKGLVNYKIVQKEPYQFRSQKLLSYNDYYDSIVPSKHDLEFISDNNENWDFYSLYSYDSDSSVNLYVKESGFTTTFTIGNGVPAKYNSSLTSFEVSASTNVVFNSYLTHNLNVGDYVKVKMVSGSTSTDIGVFPVVGIGSKNNKLSEKLFTIKLTGFTGTYIQFKRFLNTSDNGSLSEYYIRKYKVIEDSGNYKITTPLSKNGFGNNNYFLTNNSEIDVSGLLDEKGLPITNISFFFKKKNTTSTTRHTITKIKNSFYDEYYRGRNGFISRELYQNNTNFFINGTGPLSGSYNYGLMVSGLTNTYRSGSITPEGVYLSDDAYIFESDANFNVGSYIDFTDGYFSYSGLTGLTRSVIYRVGDDFSYNSQKYFSLFSEYLKKPISLTSGDTFTLLGIKPSLTNYGSSRIAGSSLYPGNSMVYINNQISNFPIGRTVYFMTGLTDTLKSGDVLGYELGGLYAVINNSSYSTLPTSGYTNLTKLQYYGDSYEVKLSDLMYEHFVVYYLGDNETKININDSIGIGDVIYGDIVEYNARELKTNTLQNPNYLFKLKDLYGYTGSTFFSGVTSTYAKTDLLYPLTLKYFTNTIYSTNNIEEKKSWSVFNDNLNIWEWRDIIPNGEIDETGRGTNFPFLNGRHYIYGDFILPFRSKYWNPITGNIRSLNYNSDYNYNNGVGTLQTINNIDIC